MIPSINFRRIKQEEIPELSERFFKKFPGVGEPPWNTVWVITEDGKIRGFFGLEQKVLVEPLYSESPRITRSLIDRVDAMIATIGIKQYEFQVPDINPEMQRVLEVHYGMKGEIEPPHKIYFVNRE